MDFFYTFATSFIHTLKMLLRKVERLDSVKPWQPFGNEEGATFYQFFGEITTEVLYSAFPKGIFNFIKTHKIEKRTFKNQN